MGLWAQIACGTLVLSLCSAVHILLIVLSLPWLSALARHERGEPRRHRAAILIGAAFAVVVAGHTVQVWIWAFACLALGAFDGVEPALYFSLSSYTTLGYGDLVLPEGRRIFGAFASVNGMLIFGVSTAFLVGLIARQMPQNLR